MSPMQSDEEYDDRTGSETSPECEDAVHDHSGAHDEEEVADAHRQRGKQ